MLTSQSSFCNVERISDIKEDEKCVPAIFENCGIKEGKETQNKEIDPTPSLASGDTVLKAQTYTQTHKKNKS